MGRNSSQVKDRYNKKVYDDLKIRIPKGRRADVERYVKEQGTSVNALINRFLQNTLGMTDEEWKQKAAVQKVEEIVCEEKGSAQTEKHDISSAFAGRLPGEK